MITAQSLEVRVGARLLMENVSFRVGPGDKVGLVGRNGAGKTTLTKVLAGDVLPAGGQVRQGREERRDRRVRRRPGLLLALADRRAELAEDVAGQLVFDQIDDIHR